MAPYGDDITEGIPYTLSNPTGATNFSSTGEAYDVAFNGLPFFLAASDETPYRRVTAQYRKQQIDQTREPGEQTLTGWWLRSQSSFHLGAGAKFFEPAQDESLRFQFYNSYGVDVWTRGQVSLLNDTERIVEGDPFDTSEKQLALVKNDAYLWTNKDELWYNYYNEDTLKYTASSNILSITTNGNRWFLVTATDVYAGAVNSGGSPVQLYSFSSVTRAKIRYVKQRLILALNNKLYELDPNHTSGTSLPSELFTHPNEEWIWSSIAEGPQAIYVSGYTESSSSVFKITLDPTTPNSLGFPTLNVPTVIIDMPDNEQINHFDVYLGQYAVLATSKGVRVGISDTNGDITYGPLLWKEAPCYGVAFRDSYAFVATKIGNPGFVRIDLSTTIYSNLLFFPYATDLSTPQIIADELTAGYTAKQIIIKRAGGVFGVGEIPYIVFTTSSNHIYSEINKKVSIAQLQTGYIRYNTLEHKIFKFLTPRFRPGVVGMDIYSVDADGIEVNIGSFPPGSEIDQIGVPYPNTPQQYLAFKFVFYTNEEITSQYQPFTGYQIKSLPSIPRQRLIQYPVFCYDHEMDKFNNAVGYEGSAYYRMSQLENVENAGDTIRVEDFRTGESFLGLIEELDFVNKTPTDKRFSGFGGTLLVTIRTI